jgi:hypothetical protein
MHALVAASDEVLSSSKVLRKASQLHSLTTSHLHRLTTSHLHRLTTWLSRANGPDRLGGQPVTIRGLISVVGLGVRLFASACKIK